MSLIRNFLLIGFIYLYFSDPGSNDVFTESYYECSDSPQSVPLFIQSENESSKNSISQSESNTEDNVSDTEDDENIPSDAYIEDMSEDGSYGEASNIKLPNSSFCLDDLIKPECPENLKAVEKVYLILLFLLLSILLISKTKNTVEFEL